MKKVINTVAQSVTFTFDGDLAPVVITCDTLSDDVILHAQLHGIAQKIGDNAAISKSADNGYTVTEAMRRAAVVEMAEQLRGGAWNAKREGANMATAQSLKAAIEVIVELTGCSIEEATAQIAAKRA